jgi:antitoxin MazE
MDLQVNRWGNSLAVRLPAGLVRELAAHEGSKLEAKVSGPGRLELVNPEVAQSVPSRKQVLAELDALHARLPMGRSVIRFMRDEGY